jgi:hypothetical protein
MVFQMKHPKQRKVVHTTVDRRGSLSRGPSRRHARKRRRRIISSSGRLCDCHTGIEKTARHSERRKYQRSQRSGQARVRSSSYHFTQDSVVQIGIVELLSRLPNTHSISPDYIRSRDVAAAITSQTVAVVCREASRMAIRRTVACETSHIGLVTFSFPFR